MTSFQINLGFLLELDKTGRAVWSHLMFFLDAF